MNKLEYDKNRKNMTEALNKMSKTHAKYVLEHYLGYPLLEYKGRPDLQCEAESIGVEVTCCEEDRIYGWLIDIANGQIFPENVKKSEEKLFEKLLWKKRNYACLEYYMPPRACWKTFSDAERGIYIQKVKKLMHIRASALVIPERNSTELITKILVQAVDEKMGNLPTYEQFKRMESFIWLPSLSLDDNNDVQSIHTMLQKHVFAKTPCFRAVHILISSNELQSMALFTFTAEDVQRIKVSSGDLAGDGVFEQNGMLVSRDPQFLCDTLKELDRQVDEKINEILNNNYPDSAWDELWEELKEKYPDREKKEESGHGDQQQIP